MKLLVIYFFTATFLITSLSKPDSYVQTDPLKESITRGSEIYEDFCVTCHMPNGKGVTGSFPPLAKSDYLMSKREYSIKAIKFGQEGELMVNGDVYNNTMAPLGLANDEIADVMNYITNSWGNKNEKIVTEAEVAKIKK